MKGLLYKDFLLVRKNIILGFLTIASGALFAIIFILGMNIGNLQELKELDEIYNLFFKGTIYTLCLAGATVALSSSSSIEQDDKAEWYKVLYSSPITIWQEIFSRYIVAFLVNTIMCVWSGCLLPMVYMAGKERFGFAECKIILYCWLIGMILILIRLPLDIVFSAKNSAIISGSILTAFAIAMTGWLGVEEETEKIVSTLAGWIRWIYDHGIFVVIAVVGISFSVSYFGKRNRRWA